jgi:hypothetical protein
MTTKTKAAGGNPAALNTTPNGSNSISPDALRKEADFLELASRLDHYGQTLAHVRGDDDFRFMAYCGQWTKFFCTLDEVEAFAVKVEGGRDE